MMTTIGPGRVLRRSRAAGFILTALALFATAGVRAGQLEFYDPFEIMAEVRRLEAQPLWPGFDPGAVPTGLFDGERTILFDFPKIPPGFKPMEGRAGVLVHEGPHPAVFGNTRVRFDDVWMAASIPVCRSEFTGLAISLTDIAGIVIHEKFHVFQAIHHPGWRPNDAVLLVYPPDTAKVLKARSLELEALRRAVLSFAPGAAAWAKTALALRRERQADLDDDLTLYERESQRFEGLAEYVEYKASGKPAAEDRLPIGFAPKAVREMGYLEGRWMADLLDRFDPGWQDGVEAGRIAYLEERLAEVLREGPRPAEFTADEEDLWTSDVRTAMARKYADRQRMLRQAGGKLGITLIIEARNRPLRFQVFDPFSLETLGPHELFHSQYMSLKNEQGVVAIVGMQVLTETDAGGRVVRLIVSGLSRRPYLRTNLKDLRFQWDGVYISLRSVRFRARGPYAYVLDLD